MKYILFVLLSPLPLNAQQAISKPPAVQSTINSKDSTDFSDLTALTKQLSSLRTNVSDIIKSIEGAQNKWEALKQAKSGTMAELTSAQQLLKEKELQLQKEKKLTAAEQLLTGKDASKTKAEIAALQQKIDDLQKKLTVIDLQIKQTMDFIEKQLAEIDKLQNSINEVEQKIDELERRNREANSLEKKPMVASTEDEKTVAYSHIRIINDSLPPIINRLTIEERNIINTYNEKFNNDAAFRTRTQGYIKQSLAANYFANINKAGPTADQQTRFLSAIRDELAIIRR